MKSGGIPITGEVHSTGLEHQDGEAVSLALLTRFNEYVAQMASIDTQPQAVQQTVSHVLRSMKADLAAMFLFEPDGRFTYSGGVDAQGSALPVELLESFHNMVSLQDGAAGVSVVTGHEPAREELNPAGLQVLGMKAWIRLPLKRSPVSPLGVLLVGFYEPRSFSAGEVEALRMYATHASHVTEFLRLQEESRRREMDLGVMVDTAHLLISTLDMEELLQQIAVRLAWVTGTNSCAISSFYRDPDRVIVVGQYTALGERIEDRLHKEFLLEESPLYGAVLENNEPRVVHLSSANTEAAAAEQMRQQGAQTLLMLPLKAGGEPIGLLELYSKRPDQSFNLSEIRRLRALSEQVALALVNARLYHREHESRVLAEAVREISLALSRSLNPNAVLKILLEQIEKVIPYDTACVMILDGEFISVAMQRGFDQYGTDLSDFHLRVEDTPNLRLMSQTLEPHFIPDVMEDSNWIEIPGSGHIRSWLGAPLIGRDRLLGFLSLDKGDSHFYTSQHATSLAMLAGHASLALLNAYTFDQVEQASITDFLTNSYNHRYFHQQLRDELERAQRICLPLSLLMIDLDHFKQVNDTYGHLYGDQVLKLISAKLKAELRSSDLLSRYGGEEFAVILPGTSERGAAGVAERLRKSICSQEFFINDQHIPVTISIGLAVFPDHSQDAQKLIAYADAALYKAKNQGRNRVVITGKEA